MCPPPAHPAIVDAGSTDEEIVLFLGERKIGDLFPLNVITDVDPFSFEPWDSPENMWYMYSSQDPQPDDGGSIIRLNKTGYWRSIDLRAVTTMSTIGRKTTREFYLGQAPLGDRTGWVMHEYQAEQSSHPRMSKAWDHNSLYRVFLESDPKTKSTGLDKRLSSDSADGEYLKSRFLDLLDQNVCNSSRDESNRFELVVRDEQKTLSLPKRSPQNLPADDSCGDIQASYNFCKGDYLELKDLCSVDMCPSNEDNSRAHILSEEGFLELNDLYSQETSSSSDNSSIMSVNSDDYFDPDELIRDLENASDQKSEEGRSDCSFSVFAPAQSNKLIFRLPSPSLILRNNENLVAGESVTTSSMHGKGQAYISFPPSSSVDLPENEKTLACCTSKGSRANQIVAASQAKRTTQGLGSRSGSRIAKLGKKYCCFASF